MSPSPIYARSLAGLILYKSCSCSSSSCEFIFGKYCLTEDVYSIWLLQLFFPFFWDDFWALEEEGGVMWMSYFKLRTPYSLILRTLTVQVFVSVITACLLRVERWTHAYFPTNNMFPAMLKTTFPSQFCYCVWPMWQNSCKQIISTMVSYVCNHRTQEDEVGSFP